MSKYNKTNIIKPEKPEALTSVKDFVIEINNERENYNRNNHRDKKENS